MHPHAILRRHFFLSFFRSDTFGDPDSARLLVTGFATALLSFQGILLYFFVRKYVWLSSLENGRLFAGAYAADRVFLITLSMLLITLIAVVRWTTLFPAATDIRVLTPLPIETRTVFLSKMEALAIFMAIFILAVNLLPTLLFPAVSAGRHNQAHPLRRVLAHAVAFGAAGIFAFASVTALQGVMLIVLRAAAFARWSLRLQALLVSILVIGLTLVFGIPSLHSRMQSLPDAFFWLPPFWFLSLYDAVLGNAGVAPQWCAQAALLATFLMVALTLAAYGAGYRKLISGGGMPDIESAQFRPARLRSGVLRLVAKSPVRRAAFDFMLATLVRSREHKLLTAVYGACALALVLNGFLSSATSGDDHGLTGVSRFWIHASMSAPLVMLFLLMAGLRHTFSVPAELPANWVFRLSEAPTREELLDSVPALMLWLAIVPPVTLGFVLQTRYIGLLPAAFIAIVNLVIAVALREWLLRDWCKMPFTCSYTPPKTDIALVFVVYGTSFSLFSYTFAQIELFAVQKPFRYLILLLITVGILIVVRRRRREQWAEFPLVFDDQGEPDVRRLGLLD